MRDIKGYEDLYAVTEDGRVWAYPRKRSSKNGLWLKQQVLIVTKNRVKSYKCYTVLLYKDKKSKRFLVHRLVAQAYILNPGNKPEVNHINGNTFKNEIDNLEWATRLENMQHAQNSGLLNQYTEKQIVARHKNGKMHGKENGAKALRKFSTEQAKHIKRLRKQTKRSFASLGREFNVSPKTIANICYDKTYRFEI